MAEVLTISNGVDSVDFLSNTSFSLVNWEPSISPIKNGGVIQNSPIAPGGRLVYRQFDDAVETFTLAVGANSQDDAITHLRNLTDLLEQATAYQLSEYSATPVYLSVKSSSESNTRYALIKEWRIEKFPHSLHGTSPFNIGISLAGTNFSAGLNQVILVIKRDHWLSHIPGTGASLSLKTVESFDNVNLGTVDSAGADSPLPSAYIRTTRIRANISNVHLHDVSAGTFSANQVGVSLPYNLFATPFSVNDVIYFGSRSSVSGFGPFNSIVFDIGTAASPAITMSIEYWNGAWTAIPVIIDRTNGFSLTGVRIVYWQAPDDWLTSSTNGVSGYWVRFRMTNLNGGTTIPTQANRDVYAVSWPYVEIDSSFIKGDIPSLAQIRIDRQDLADNLSISTFIMATRSTSRGANFTPILHFSSHQNPSGATVIALGTVGVTETTDTSVPARSYYEYVESMGAGNELELISITLDSSLAVHFRGKFKLMLSVMPTALDIDIYIKVYDQDGTFYTTKTVRLIQGSTVYWVPTDFGIIDILSGEYSSEIPPQLQLVVVGIAPTDGDYEGAFYQLHLIPVDEFCAQIEPTMQGGHVEGDDYLLINGLSKSGRYAIARSSDDISSFRYSVKSASPPGFRPNTTQRLYFFTSPLDWPEIFSVQITNANRYLTTRGSS